MSASDTPSSSIFDFLPQTLTPAAQPGRLVSMRAQYIVDLSVSLHEPTFNRQRMLTTQLGVHVDTATHTADMHEVRLSLRLQGSIDDIPIVEVELTYGGLTWSEGIFSGEELAMALRIDAAALLYPMARAIIVDNLAHVGCPVEIPVPNFHDLYDRHIRGGAAA